MRKVAAAALAVPVLAFLYLPVLARRPIAARLVLVGTVGIVVFVAALGLARPIETTATPPAPPITALPDAAFRSITSGLGLHAAVPIRFSEAMDRTSVAASLTVEPATAVRLEWSSDDRTVTVRPTTRWTPGTYQVVTVEAGALAASGRPMASVVRAAFVTRAATTGTVAATRMSGSVALPSTGFLLRFDAPVEASAVQAALRITPTIAGTLTAVSGRPEATPSAAKAFLFTPAAPLDPATSYSVELAKLLDPDGAPVVVDAGLSVTTSRAPRIVRFRPMTGATSVDRAAPLSVRFTEPMSRSATAAAFRVTANGAVVRGTTRFVESSTVLIFTPSAPMPAGATVIVSVGASAVSANGVPLTGPVTATIRTKAAPKATPKPRPMPTSRPKPSGGGAVGGGSWGAVETYYLRLMNCTRTGGIVTSSGGCSGPGRRNVAALKLDAGISSKVSRPYAKKIAVANVCTHFIDGTPGDRLARAGYTSYRWAENLGCRSGNPYAAVLGSHLFFQSEKSTNGGHYVNLMNPAYDRCGIGVWVSKGQVRLVVDFYHR